MLNGNLRVLATKCWPDLEPELVSCQRLHLHQSHLAKREPLVLARFKLILAPSSLRFPFKDRSSEHCTTPCIVGFYHMLIHIGSNSEPYYCAVNRVGEPEYIGENDVSLAFAPSGPIDAFRCSTDGGETFDLCKYSLVKYCM